MYSFLSRSDRLIEYSLKEANEGKFSIIALLYPSEMKRVRKQWHANGTQLSRCPDNTGKYVCLISWDSSFSHVGLNFQQSWYVTKLQEQFPSVENFAQRLFLISARNSK